MSDVGERTRRVVLVVDDDAAQLRLASIRLREAGFDVKTARGAAEGVRTAAEGGIDVIVSDVLMDDLDGFAFCKRVRELPALAAVPVLLVSAHFEEADRCLAASVGAAALVQKSPRYEDEIGAIRSMLASVVPAPAQCDPELLFEQHAASSARQIHRLLGEARVAHQGYRALFENSPEPISVLSGDGVVLEVNRGMVDLFQLPAEKLVGRHIRDLAAPGDGESNSEEYRTVMRSGGGWSRPVPVRRGDGTTLLVQFLTIVVEADDGRVALCIGHDVTERLRAAQALSAAEQKYRALLERLPDVVWTAGADRRTRFVTPNCQAVLGFTSEQICSAPDFWIRHVHPDDAPAVRDAFTALMSEGKLFDIEYRWHQGDQRWIWVRSRATAVYEQDGSKHADGMVSDVTQRRQLEDSLRQAQKMEAIGQLTGGIAHDFNNVLAAVIANSHFLLEELAEGDPRRTDAEEIRKAAERAASLTRQLLAFSRRQVLEPTILDLNQTVTGLEKMLRRLIGEDIDLQIAPAPALGAVSADVGQIEQVIMNLVVNARDAMPSGGRLTIETANVTLDGADPSNGPVVPGQYVMVAVSDTGTGMTDEVKRRLFEPFFTTKEAGKGTGLGLSTCYGIVKQSGGYIWVHSELGEETVFKVYLPRVDGHPADVRPSSATPELNGKETVLVVEDDSRVRTAVIRILAARGYRVLRACDGWEALGVARLHDGPIDLILSDMVMPGCSGPDMVKRVQATSQATKALFMSGYTDHALLRHEALQGGMSFIQKPFAPEALARKVREVLDG